MDMVENSKMSDYTTYCKFYNSMVLSLVLKFYESGVGVGGCGCRCGYKYIPSSYIESTNNYFDL